MSRRASILFAAAAAAGCSAPVADDAADANGAMTEGVVVVEHRMAGDGTAQTNVSAKFMRLSTPVDPDLAERLVGAKLEVPSYEGAALQAVGVCRQTSSSAPDAPRGALGTIELIDVGDLTLRSGSALMPLAPRTFPDVGDLVSGMFYTSPDTVRELPTHTTYSLESSGSSFVDRFTIDAEAPPALDDVRIGDTALADGVTLDEGAPATIHWTASDARDLVLVDVSAPSGASVRCAYPDQGTANLPGWVLRGTTLGALPATATVTVHRIRERSFVAPGIDAGELRFDLSVLGRVVVH
jgi:hypothetical protein